MNVITGRTHSLGQSIISSATVAPVFGMTR